MKAEGGSSAGRWIELSVEADVEAVEAVSEILSRVAPGGVTVEPAFELVDEGVGARVDPSRPSVVRAYIPARDPVIVEQSVLEVDTAVGHLQAFGLRPISAVATRIVHEDDWAEAWKAHFPVLRVGRRLVIRPSWRRHRPLPGDVVLALDPGMAFGTGLHPTTRLCLAALDDLADAGEVNGAGVLDVGCGSGILSIAAARLGARSVVAVDPDPIAVEATRANARKNRLARRIQVRQGSIPTTGGPFDVVVANVIASLLVSLSAALGGETRRGGRLLASGIYVDRERDVRDALSEAGFSVDGRTVEGDWVALTATRR